jgi:hypothetical protein
MLKNLIILSVFIFGGITNNVIAQNSSDGEIVYFIEHKIIYLEYDTNLSVEGEILIDTIFQRIIARHKDTLSFFEKREIILNSFSTSDERMKNKLIGMQRCIIILDYIEKKYGVSRSNILIRDLSPKINQESAVQLLFPPPRTSRTK